MAQQAIIVFHFYIPARVDKKDSHWSLALTRTKAIPDIRLSAAKR
jgi:hypothetical protein